MTPQDLPETTAAISELHSAHHRSATRLERVIELAVHTLGRASVISALLALGAAWIVGNVLLSHLGHPPFDPPPFPWLQLAASLASLGATMVILAAQRRDARFNGLREQLILELSAISEAKLAKIISLLEESRRDNPLLADRPDLQAEKMAEPVDTAALSEIVRERHMNGAPPPASTLSSATF